MPVCDRLFDLDWPVAQCRVHSCALWNTQHGEIAVVSEVGADPSRDHASGHVGASLSCAQCARACSALVGDFAPKGCYAAMMQNYDADLWAAGGLVAARAPQSVHAREGVVVLATLSPVVHASGYTFPSQKRTLMIVRPQSK